MFIIAAIFIFFLLLFIDYNIFYSQIFHALNYNYVFIYLNFNLLTLYIFYLTYNYNHEKNKHVKLTSICWGTIGFIASGFPSSIFIYLNNPNEDNVFVIFSAGFSIFSFLLFYFLHKKNNKKIKTNKYYIEVIEYNTLDTIGEGRYTTVQEMHRLKRDGLFPLIVSETIILLGLISYFLMNHFEINYVFYLLLLISILFLFLYLFSLIKKYHY